MTLTGILIGLAALFIISSQRRARCDRSRTKTVSDLPPQPEAIVKTPGAEPDVVAEVAGYARIIDGDSLIIAGQDIRLFGVDAPEYNHPYGQTAKWALIHMCKGQIIRAAIIRRDPYDRAVARCFLPDGRDLSAEMVKQGLAVDWPKFSGGIYQDLEPEGVRKKLWLADARQKGRKHVWESYEARKISGKTS